MEPYIRMCERVIVFFSTLRLTPFGSLHLQPSKLALNGVMTRVCDDFTFGDLFLRWASQTIDQKCLAQRQAHDQIDWASQY